jgi:hypothetical protein
VDQSDTVLALPQCLIKAAGQLLERDLQRHHLGRGGQREGRKDHPDALVFRLRRRIERATPAPVPLQAKPGAGQMLRAPLRAD